MEETRVNYKQIEEANSEIGMLQLSSNKSYAPVNERLKAYRKVYPTGRIATAIENQNEESITMIASVSDEEGNILATARASEQKTEKGINSTNLVENCETSALGRALGFAGFGIDTSVATAEDMEKVDTNKQFQISKRFYISNKEALVQARLTINELYKKMGMRVQDLNDLLQEKLWTNLNDMTIWQLLKLETELKKANMEESEWHCLYNQNTKTKEVVPKNQEVVYKSTWRRFGEMALKLCGTDELKRQEVIDEYLNMEIDLGTTYES